MSTTPPNRVIPLTDSRGKHLLPENLRFEPLHGSVVLTEGLHGTAWQRHFADGEWHSTRGGRSKTWASLIKQRNLVLIYDAERREPGCTQRTVTPASLALRSGGA